MKINTIEKIKNAGSKIKNQELKVPTSVKILLVGSAFYLTYAIGVSMGAKSLAHLIDTQANDNLTEEEIHQLTDLLQKMV